MSPIPTVILFTAHRTPHPSDPVGAEEFYATLGKFTVAWGRLEGHFAGALLQILALPEASVIAQPLPQSWRQRAELWRAAFNRIPSLALERPQAIAFIDAVMAEVVSRHLGAHAIWGEFVKGASETTIHARTVKPRKGESNGIEVKDYEIKLSQLIADLQTANDLNVQLTPLTLFLGALRQPPRDVRWL